MRRTRISALTTVQIKILVSVPIMVQPLLNLSWWLTSLFNAYHLNVIMLSL